MYFTQFLKKLFRKSNSGLIAFFSVNIIIIAALLIILFIELNLNTMISIIIGIIGAVAIYLIFIALIMTPIGEALFRMNANCSKPDEDTINYIQPIFDSVYEKAKRTDPTISDKVKLYQNKKDKSINAFAIGKNTICVCDGIKLLPPNEIESIIAHEFGHLAHYDTTISLGIVVGNIFLTFLMNAGPVLIRIFGFGLRILFYVISFLPIIGTVLGLLSSLISLIIDFVVEGYIFLFTRICKLWMNLGFYLCQKSSRECEFESDEYAYKLGYGSGLVSFFSKFQKSEYDNEEPDNPILVLLASSHPPIQDRIDRLNSFLRDESN